MAAGLRVPPAKRSRQPGLAEECIHISSSQVRYEIAATFSSVVPKCQIVLTFVEYDPAWEVIACVNASMKYDRKKQPQDSDPKADTVFFMKFKWDLFVRHQFNGTSKGSAGSQNINTTPPPKKNWKKIINWDREKKADKGTKQQQSVWEWIYIYIYICNVIRTEIRFMSFMPKGLGSADQLFAAFRGT